MKKCLKCNEEKTLESFYNNKRAKDGKHIYCKDCEKKRKQKYWEKNKEQVNRRRRELTELINKIKLKCQR